MCPLVAGPVLGTLSAVLCSRCENVPPLECRVTLHGGHGPHCACASVSCWCWGGLCLLAVTGDQGWVTGPALLPVSPSAAAPSWPRRLPTASRCFPALSHPDCDRFGVLPVTPRSGTRAHGLSTLQTGFRRDVCAGGGTSSGNRTNCPQVFLAKGRRGADLGLPGGKSR